MRIGLVAPPWIPLPPPAYGGTEQVVDTLARGLAEAGHDVVLAAPTDSTCPVRRVPGLLRSQRDRMGETVPEVRHALAAYAGLAEAHVDLVHDHTVAGPLCGRRPPGVPLVVTMHTPVDAEMGPLYRAVPPRTAVVAISHAQARTARGVPVRRVIHHGIDVARVPVGPGTGGYACWVGRMSPSKGVREAVRIARAADIPLRLAGKMEARAEVDYFRARVEPLLGGPVEYLGEVTAAERAELLAGAVALVNPIRWEEPFGMVMIEALAAGTPVVATSRGSAPEIVEDGVTGFLRDDLAGLTAALDAVAHLDRSVCRRAAEERFCASRMVADHVDLYAEVLHRRPRRAGVA